MKSRFVSLVILVLLINLSSSAQNLAVDYVERWKEFYPSQALARGMQKSVYYYEDRGVNTINSWLSYNKRSLEEINKGNAKGDPIDLRLIKVKMMDEIHTWEKEQPHHNSLSMYAQLISRAIGSVTRADYLSSIHKNKNYCVRLSAMNELAKTATISLKTVGEAEAPRGIRMLESTVKFLKNDFDALTENLHTNCDFKFYKKSTIESIEELIQRVKTILLPNGIKADPLLGQKEYARRLALYTDSELTPEGLAEMALSEINIVKQIITEVSEDYLKKAYPNEDLPSESEEVIARAFSDMEKDAPLNAQNYLEFWLDLEIKAKTFIQENKIATLPETNTLRIETAPESAGPAARIGWVASAPPFDPDPITTLFLPSIPDTLPQQEQVDFWRSFNKPFNRMIVIHELLPGHYMQMKISSENASPARLLFPYGTFIEGWATFTEKVLLDAGWEKDNPLTYLAHLRKRLENANRAYTSVMVHTQGWTQEQVMDFSTNTSLVAPQFAKSLWGRIMRSPLQLTSYFLGGAQFTKLWETEKERLGDKFNLAFFMDTIMKAGPIPIIEFQSIFKQIAAK